ncbi:MAG: V-type ATP synthase subunit I [Hadesarchaea archaeon]|nr:V-type ATP synthase subunit I [Hadesarchaea archaeon]
MFKTARMKKFRVIFHRRAHDDVVARLHEAGVIQLKEITELEVTRKAVGEEVYELSSLLTKFKEMEEFLGPASGKPTTVKQLTFEQTLKLAKKGIGKLGPKVTQLKEKSDGLEKERQDLLAQIGVLEKFREIRFPLRYLRSTDEIRVAVGYIAEERVKEFFAAVKEALARRVFTSTIGAGKRRIVVVACRAQDQQKLSPVFYRYEVELLELPPFSGSPAAAIKELKKRLAKTEGQQRGLERAVRRLARTRAKGVSQVRELLEIQREQLECAGLFGYTDATTVIEGWVRAKQAAELEEVLSAATNGRHVLRTYDPQRAEVEAVPVELKNPQVVEDFEYVTGMYGLPKYDEVDPTPFVSFTFALFFAIALSDVGYGIALGIFMASGVWLAKIFPRKLRRMMVVCAIFTVIVGLLIGGCFGFGQGFWVNPIQRPIPLLKVVIFIGIIHLIVAFGLAGVLKDIFRRDWKSILFSRISRVLILIGFFGLGFCILGIGMYEFGLNFAFPKIDLFAAFNPLVPAAATIVAFRILFYLGLAIGIVGAVMIGKSAREKVGGPINVVYGITGLIADVTSYSRLLALGIATGVIAFSINFILGIAWGGMVAPNLSLSPAIIIAILAMIGIAFVFVAAHSFNIFINSLGGFIHTMRLHFAEFFGKFYESGGEKFTPFKAKRRFTKVEGGEWPGR